LTLRANRLRGSREALADALAARGVVTEAARFAPDGLVVTSGSPLRRPSEGRFVVQDEASQLVPLAVGAAPGEHVLDLCASPGGKTTAMAADMGDTGTLIACDVRDRRLDLLQATVRASGASHTHVVRVGTAGPLPLAPVFDRVLVDAPCSGLGTIRRDPDIRWRRRESDLAVFAEAQRALLLRAAEVVRPGGRLVYATCSSEPEENERVVEAMLQARADYRLVDLRAAGDPRLAPFLDQRGMLRTLPYAHDLEAFFAAALVRS
jgi:16S rRNA (cytosine967-C5)-methyltransferase